MPYPKKYSKSPSVVHFIRASCENAAMFSCKKSNLAGRVLICNRIKKKKNYTMPDDGTLIEKKNSMPYPKNILSPHQ